METPEIHPPHAHHGGGLPRWLELLIAITALITSISSIVIAIHHGHIMERLVQANSLPFLQGGFSDATPDGTEVLSLDLINRGVGPANEQSLRIKVAGNYVHSAAELFAASLGRDRAAGMGTTVNNKVRTRFIPGGQSQLVFRLPKTASNAQAWDLLSKDMDNWGVEYCYCSVFKDCWEVHGAWQEPAPVRQCQRDDAREFVP